MNAADANPMLSAWNFSRNWDENGEKGGFSGTCEKQEQSEMRNSNFISILAVPTPNQHTRRARTRARAREKGEKAFARGFSKLWSEAGQKLSVSEIKAVTAPETPQNVELLQCKFIGVSGWWINCAQCSVNGRLLILDRRVLENFS